MGGKSKTEGMRVNVHAHIRLIHCCGAAASRALPTTARHWQSLKETPKLPGAAVPTNPRERGGVQTSVADMLAVSGQRPADAQASRCLSVLGTPCTTQVASAH